MGKSAPPAMSASGDITRLLLALEKDHANAAAQLAPLVYAELREMAGRVFRRERPGHTLQPTALVHDAFLRLIEGKPFSLKNRAHFFAVAAHAMRQILVSHARATNAKKRGGGERKLALDEALVYSPERSAQLEALDDALDQLEKLNKRYAQIVEMRFFGGMSNEETARSLGVSISTVKNDWDFAKAWLKRELES